MMQMLDDVQSIRCRIDFIAFEHKKSRKRENISPDADYYIQTFIVYPDEGNTVGSLRFTLKLVDLLHEWLDCLA